ncbi:MAG: HEAT repeat domain-containing protein [Anaerolineae bacterium]|nr:HEAT repeat domain-containing protein [Anaerolineae bacterium]
MESECDGFIKLYAVHSLANIGTSEAIEVIARALDDPDDMVRYIAILNLGRIGDTRVLPKLTHILEEDATTLSSFSLTDEAKKAIEEIRKRCGE